MTKKTFLIIDDKFEHYSAFTLKREKGKELKKEMIRNLVNEAAKNVINVGGFGLQKIIEPENLRVIVWEDRKLFKYKDFLNSEYVKEE